MSAILIPATKFGYIMKLYYWRSKALANYGLGHIIVSANNIEEARNEAIEYIKTGFLEAYPHKDLDIDEDFVDFENFRHQIKLDLHEGPKQTEVLFIQGSE